MPNLFEKMIITPEFTERFCVFIDFGTKFNFGFIGAAQLGAIAPIAACVFKLPPGCSAVVEIYKDGATKHIFNVQIINSFELLQISVDAATTEFSSIASVLGGELSGECVAECPDGSMTPMSTDCPNILTQTAECYGCDENGNGCRVRCVGSGGGG